MFQKRKYLSWTLQERRRYLLDIMRHRKHIGSIPIFKYILISAEILPSMGMEHLVYPDRLIQVRPMMKRLYLLELQRHAHMLILQKSMLQRTMI